MKKTPHLESKAYKISKYVLIWTIIVLIWCLMGCAKTTPTDTIIDNAIATTQAAIHTVKQTTTVEQCQALATEQYKTDIRNMEAAKASAQRDIKAEQEKTLRWKIISAFIGIILAAIIAKKVLK